jgi:hypothetical protein
MEQNDIIDALQAERAGYVSRGLKDRVAQVDTELARLGVKTRKPNTRQETAVDDTGETRPA